MAGSENPYVGPRPYEIGETLYGREREIAELYYLLAAERIVLLHSPSGAGKSSLVQAGLIPRLRERFDVWRPTRVNQEPPPEFSGNRYALSALAGFEEGIPPALRRPAAELAGMRLLEYAQARPKRPGAPASALLIFDQFEEVLTVDPLGLAGKGEFFDQLGELLRQPEIWALFVLREDYLAPLDPYARQVPTHLQNRYRIDLLGRAAAAEAIVRPALAGGREFAPEAVERLVEDLATVKVQQADGSFAAEAGPSVEPVQLQVVCRRLWGELPAETATIGPAELARFGDVTEALAAYYRTAVEKVGGGRAGERRIREWFDRGLIKPGGIRGQVLRGGPESAGLAERAIGALLGSHLIRAEKRAGATWYELAHDRLIEPVQRDNAAWFRDNLSELERGATLWEAEGRPASLLPAAAALAEAQAWAASHAAEMTEAERRYLAAAAEAETAATAEDRRRQLEEKARQARRARNLALAACAGLVLALAGAFYARTQRHRAEHETQRSQDLFRAATAGNLLADGKTTRGNLVALEIEKPETTQTALATLHRALANLAETAVLSGHRKAIDGAAWSPDSQRVATASADGTARVWNADDGKALAVLLGHGGTVTSVQWSPDGRRLLTASADGTARLWNAADGRSLQTFAGHAGTVRGALFRPDGERLVTTSDDGTARIWSVGGELLRTLALGAPARAAEWSPDGRRLATLAQDCRIWDAESGRPLATLEHGAAVTAVAWSPDGASLITASEDHTARIWSGRGERRVTVLHSGIVRAVAWSPDGRRVITTSDDATARIWYADTGASLLTLVEHSGPVLAAAFSSDGTRVVTASSDGTARVWSATTGTTLTTLRGHDGPLRGVVWSPDGTHAVTASMDDTARIWNLDAGETLTTLTGHAGPLRAAAWSPDGRRIATASNDRSARLWDAVSGRTLLSLSGHAGEVRAIAWSPDGRRVATGSEDRTAKIWDAATGALRLTLPHDGTVRAVAWSPDGHRLATAALDGAARIWNATTGAAPVVLHHGERSWVMSVSFSPDGRRVVTASTDRTARIWDAATGRPLAVLAGHRDAVWSAAWSPDGRAVATASMDGTAGLWDAASGRRLFSLAHEGKVFAVAWTPDGTRLVTVSGDDTARLWDAVDGHPLAVLLGHDQPIVAVAFSPDGRQVATASEDGTARVWNAQNGEAVALLRGHEAALTAVAWSPEGDRLLTASADKTVHLWAGSAFLLQAEIRARTPLCLKADERQQLLAETAGDAKEYADDCVRCQKDFSRDLGHAPPADWQAHRKAWQAYKKCVFAAM